MSDPGASGTIAIDRQMAVVPVVTAAAEARTLAQPTKAGLVCIVVLETRVGDATLTVTGGYNQAADTAIVFNTAGDWVRFASVKVGASYYWRVLSSEGTTLAGGENALTGVAAGTVAASKAVIVSADKDAGDFRNLDCVNLDAGSSGAAGTIDVFPTTASRGKLELSCTDQTGDTTVSVVADAMAAARTIHLPDPGKTSYLMQSTAPITCAEADVLDDAVAGTAVASKAVVVDANKDVGDFRNVGYSGALTGKAGATAAAVALRLGATATEGLEIKVIDETVNLTNAVETNLTETVPAGAVILSVQANLQTTVVGDASGDNGLVKVGIGITADPDKYGKSADLVKNHKIDTIPDWAVLSGAETVCVKGCDAAGAAVTEKFVADVPAGTRDQVRVRIVYAVPNSLDDAA